MVIIGIIVILVGAWFAYDLFFKEKCGDGEMHINKILDMFEKGAFASAGVPKDWLIKNLKPDKNGCVLQSTASNLDWASLGRD